MPWEAVRALVGAFRIPTGRRPPRNLGPLCWTARASTGGGTGWVSGEWPGEFSRSENGVRRGEATGEKRRVERGNSC